MKNTPKKERQGVFVSFEDLSELRDELKEGFNRIESKISASSPGQSETYLTVKQVADLLQCSPATVQRIKNSGALKFYTINGKLLAKKSDVIKVLESGPVN